MSSKSCLFCFCILLAGFEAVALDFKTGQYDLVKGDPDHCEEGPLLLKNEQLSLGAKWVFPDFKKASLEFDNDDKNCRYSIQNIHDEKNYEQLMTVSCRSAPAYKRSVKFTAAGEGKLLVRISEKNKAHLCELKWKK